MAYKLIKREFCDQLHDYIEDYIADTEDDAANLPEACTGSSALVVNTGKIYVVNAVGNWTLVGG